MKMEEALRESDGRFRTAFEDSKVGMCLLGLDSRFIAVNRSLCEMFGYSKEEMLKRPFTDFTHPDDVEKSTSWVQSMLAGEATQFQIEKRYLHRDGRTIWADVSTSLFRGKDGSPLYFITEIQNTTERRMMETERAELEESLLQSRQKLRILTQDDPTRFVESVDEVIRIPGIWRGGERKTPCCWISSISRVIS